MQILLLMSVIAAFYFPTVSQLFQRWILWDQSLSHGLPTLGIFLFLIWRAQPWAYQADSVTRRLGLCILLCLTSVVWFLFDKIQIGILAYLALLPLLWLLIAASYSVKTALQLSIPIGILIFTIPLWEQLTELLVALSASAIGLMGRLVDIPILIDGNNIFIPYGRLYIDDGCSGLRYLTIALLMAYLIACVHYYRLRQAIIAMVLAAALALLMNWIRIFLLVMIGYYTDMQSSLMQDHEMFGWILFACVMFPSVYFAPVYRRKETQKNTEPVKFRPLWPLLALASGPLLTLLFSNVMATQSLVSLEAINQYRDFTPSVEVFATIIMPAGGTLEKQEHKIGDTRLQVELAQYPQRDPREKIVPYFGTLYDKANWIYSEEITTHNLAQQGVEISLLRRVNSQQQLVFLHRYQVGSYATSRYDKAKLLQFPAVILSENYFNIFTIQAVCNKLDCDDAIAAATQIATTWIESQ